MIYAGVAFLVIVVTFWAGAVYGSRVEKYAIADIVAAYSDGRAAYLEIKNRVEAYL